MSEQELREFEENIVKGAHVAFQRLVSQKKKENGELVFSRNGHIFRVKASEIDKYMFWWLIFKQFSIIKETLLYNYELWITNYGEGT